ncbi:MAG: DNA polymerase III subunit epsilon [Rickettsiales bacterium]
MVQFREIVLDTETTGLNPKGGDRLVEVGCVELINKVRTGNTFHRFVNPEREVPEEVVRIHGLTTEFLKDKPLFKHVANEFVDFIGTSNLVIHNANFDLGFINAEFAYVGIPQINPKRVTDTLMVARKKFPGSPASLDALCKKYNISLHTRDKHGALIDAELLALVYIELSGGAQNSLVLEAAKSEQKVVELARQQRQKRSFDLTPEEEANHKDFLKAINSPLWEG